ncbi:hypothetical protein [Piscinibacter sp. XHJ-5]|uniref:hypothetical protein n=1 Tax=Piscinibacter sp. XHJ-5 TaxID=3037797 RepID=UPI0024530EC6|nr:hypothetical protein [Piscinibacter sp. XHJ-5]
MAAPRIWYDPPPFSWGRVVRIGLIWLAVVVVLLVLMPSPPREERAAKPPAEELPLAYVPPASRPLALATSAASGPPRTAVAAVTAVREIEACGGRRLKVAADKPVDASLLEQVDTRDVRLRSVTAMRYGGEAARAAAALLDTPGPAALEAVANAAATGHDARAYGLAFRACGGVRPPQQRGSCQLLSADQWSRLDPDNAAPWLYVAALAQQRGDEAGVSEAMQRVAKAKRVDDVAGVLPSLVLQHAPRDDASLLPTVRLLGEVLEQQAAWSLPAYGTAHTFCSDSAVRDPARRQTCGEIADLLVQRSTTLIEHANGAAIGKRVGWTDEKIQALKTERDAIGEVTGRALALEGDPFSCAWARRGLAHHRSVAEQGEVETGRVAIRQSGRDAEQWAKAARERMEKAPQVRRGGG